MLATRTRKAFLSLIACLLVVGVSAIVMRACGESKGAHPELMSGKADIVFFRNYRVPAFDFRYSRLDKKYGLGKAVVIPPSATWLKLAGQLGITRDVSEFPLVFAQMRRSKGGRELLVVVQLAHKFAGDSLFSGAGPVIIMEMVTVEGYGTATPRMVWSGSTHLGTMQGSCLYVGKADAADASKFQFKMEIESGHGKTVTMELLDDGSLNTVHKP